MKWNLLIFTFSLLLSVTIAEVALRAYMTRSVSSTPVEGGQQGWTIFDDRLGWRPEPGAVGKEGGVRISINSAGARGEEFLGPPSILALGDSFTLGALVNDSEPWPNILNKKFDSQVANFGVCGHGIDQMYLLWEELSQNYEPEKILLGVISDNFFRSGLKRWITGQERPVVEIGEGGPELVSATLSRRGVDGKVFIDWQAVLFDWSRVYLFGLYDDISHLNRTPRFYRRSLQKSHKLIQYMSEQSKRAGSEFYVVLLSQSYPFQDIEKELTQNAVEYIDCRHVLENVENIIQGDGHPSPRGHRAYAKCVEDYFVDK